MAEALLWLRELAAAGRMPPEIGGKARHLALLCAGGLPVPDGFVLPSGSAPEMAAAAERLGGPLVVRSSSALEDQPEGAAPGLFSSRLDIWPDDLARAIAEVRASAGRPGVRAYLARRGLPPSAPPPAVVVQRQVRGARGVLYTRPPGQPERDEVWLETARSDGLASTAVVRRGGAMVARDADFPLDGDRIAALVELGLAAEKAIGGPPPGADVEWVADDRNIWLVQARPIRQTAAPAPVRESELAFSRGDETTIWRWDAPHNPDPLTPAQVGLVELVAGIGPDPMRVVDGYLYVASSGEAKADGRPTAAEVRKLFEEVRGEILAALAPVERTDPPDLAGALAAYRAVYRAYMVRLAPVLARARGPAGEAVRTESAVGRAARIGDRDALAALAPVWDVAAATFGERSDLRLDGARDPDPPVEPSDLAAVVRAIREADDLLFFRAQRAVRRALLALSEAWHLSPSDDIFYLPLDQVRARATRGEPFDPAAANRMAAAARAEREAQRSRIPPRAFRDGRPVALASGPAGLDFWRGRTAGPGAARGAVLRVEDLGHLPDDPHARVIVAQAITPAALIQLAGAAALVCEQGGVLDHAAALARELGLPCVVGCAGIWRALTPGDEVLVDGDAGLVVRLGS